MYKLYTLYIYKSIKNEVQDMVYPIFRGYRAPRTVPSRQLNITNYYQNCRHNSCGGGSIWGGGGFWGGLLGGLFASLPSLISSFCSMPIMTGYRSTYDFLNQQQHQPQGNSNVDVLTKHYGDKYIFSEVDGKFIATNKDTKETISADSLNEMIGLLQPKAKKTSDNTETDTFTKADAEAAYNKLTQEQKDKLTEKGFEITDEGITFNGEEYDYEDILQVVTSISSSDEADEVVTPEKTKGTPPAATTTKTKTNKPTTDNGGTNPVTKAEVQAKYDALSDEVKQKLKGVSITDEGIKVGDKVIKFEDIENIDDTLAELAADNKPTAGKTWSFKAEYDLKWDGKDWWNSGDANFIDVHGTEFEIVDAGKRHDHLNIGNFKVKEGESIKSTKYSPKTIVIRNGDYGFPLKKQDDGSLLVNVGENGQEKWIKLEDFLMGDYGERARKINQYETAKSRIPKENLYA